MLSRKLPILLVVPLPLLACQTVGWDAPGVRAPDYAVARALGDDRRSADVDVASVIEVDPPKALRPCCAFGVDLGVKMKGVDVPFFALANVTEPSKLGPHRYDNGLLSVDMRDRRGWVDDEKNGVVYTCRGGFLDVAHMRDYADLTVAMSSTIALRIDDDWDISLPDQGAKIRVRGRAAPPDLLGQHGRRELAVVGAQWVAFNVSIWHEIATWYGFSALEAWPEKLSAFTPDDLYANLLGTRIAGGIIRVYGTNSSDEYNRSMDAWMARVMDWLQAVPRDEAKQGMLAVDGLWWDSSKKLPDWELVTRRYMQIGTELRPWLVSMATPATPAVKEFDACEDADPPLALPNPHGFEGIPIADYATVAFEVGDELASNGFPFPRDSRVVTQADFPFIIDAIRTEMEEGLGKGFDQP